MCNLYITLQVVALIVLLSTGKYMQGALVLVYMIVHSVNHADLGRRIVFGTKASLPYEGIELITKKVGQMDQDLMSGSFYLNLLMCMFIAFVPGLLYRNFIVAALCIVQMKLLTEQHRSQPNRYIVVATHVMPSAMFYALLPPAIPSVKAIVVVGGALLFAQGISILSKLKNEGR